MNAHVEVAKLKVTVNSGEYLAHGTKTGTDCPAGSFCPGNTFSYNAVDDQGIASCAIGSYSAAKKGECTPCLGKTTSDIGSTSCNADCSNRVGVASWVEAVWNNNNSVTYICTINSCLAGYTKNDNVCTANTYSITLNNDNATTPGSDSVTVTYNEAVPTITPPTKRGYNFIGYYYIIEHDDREPDEEILYIKADGTSEKDWELIGDKTLIAKWEAISVTCSEREYLAGDATSCSSCPEGYSCSGETITYGNKKILKGVLKTGDAFDCDVNGDGTFDAATERFYFVSNYYDTSTKKFNDKYAVLVYSSDVKGGVSSTQTSQYSTQSDCQTVGTCNVSTGCNWYGPVTAKKELPTTTQWSNISLFKENRQILSTLIDTSTSGGNLPSNFSYTGYSSRLLTYQEVWKGCYDFLTELNDAYSLKTKCQFLMEKTKFANGNLASQGSWLETPFPATNNTANLLYSSVLDVYIADNLATLDYGVRPVIEVLKTEMLY